MKTKKRKRRFRMAQVRRNWESLGIENDFIFGKVMQDKDLCLKLIRRILPDLEILDISFPHSQKTVKIDKKTKGVRFWKGSS